MKTNGEQQGQRGRVPSLNTSECIWMKTGVVNFRTCQNAFDCPSCPFDKEISRTLAQKRAARGSWKEVMSQAHLNKECRHMLTGRVIFKLCVHNYECKDCAYDQLLDDYDRLLGEEDLPVHSAAPVGQITGFMMAEALQ